MDHSDIDKTWLLSRFPCRQEKRRSNKNERNLKSALPRGCDGCQVTIACYTRPVMSRLPRSGRMRKAFEVGSVWISFRRFSQHADRSMAQHALNQTRPCHFWSSSLAGGKKCSQWKQRARTQLQRVTVYFKQTTLIHAMLRYGFWHDLNTFRRVALTVGSGSLFISFYFYQFCIALTNIHSLYLFVLYIVCLLSFWPVLLTQLCCFELQSQKGWWLHWRFRSRKARARGDIWKHLETAKILGTEIQSFAKRSAQTYTKQKGGC